MNFALGDKLRVDGSEYEVIGIISYRNRMDNAMWMEYRIFSQSTRQESWLSYDEEFREYSISQVARGNVSTDGYHEVDRGVEEVIGAWGNVDVEIGDTANFLEYEDATEEKIISHEIWEDGLEVSTGYYLDYDEIQRIGTGGGVNTGGYGTAGYNTAGYNTAGGQGMYQSTGFASGGTMSSDASGQTVKKITTIVAIFIPIIAFISIFKSMVGVGTPSIAKHLEKTSTYIYQTSITGTEGEKADVYMTYQDVDSAAKDIISAIDGKTEDVQQNTEDGDDTVAILTTKEYCLIYTSEDGETLVQISTRKYAYYNDNDPYRSRTGTRRYYRRYYYSRGYTSDYGKYKSASSPYGSYSDSTLGSNPADTYNTYAGTVRQSSTTSRSSSGGGISSGK